MRLLEERLSYLRDMEERRQTILGSIEEQGKLTDELRARIEGSGVENLAQIYTQLKYSRQSHQKFSKTVLGYLAVQDFLN